MPKDADLSESGFFEHFPYFWEMKATLLSILLLVTGCLSAQKFTIDSTKDDFTGKTTIRSSDFLWGLADGHYFRFGLASIEWVNYLLADMDSEGVVYVDTDDHLILKLADDSMITLTPVSDESSDIVTIDKWNIMVVYILPEDDLLRLSTIPISKVRLESTDKNYDSESMGKKYTANAMANFAEWSKSVK